LAKPAWFVYSSVAIFIWNCHL